MSAHNHRAWASAEADRAELVTMLSELCTEEGAQARVARGLGISPSHLNDVLHGRRDPSRELLEALGVRRVVRYVIE